LADVLIGLTSFLIYHWGYPSGASPRAPILGKIQ
jgi:hypothetical protein